MSDGCAAALTPQAVVLIAAAMLLLLFTALPAENGETRIEKRAGRVLSQMEGAGRVSVVVMTRPAAQPGIRRFKCADGFRRRGKGSAMRRGSRGAGSGRPLVQMQLTQALCSLLGLPASAVSVVTGGN